MTIRQRLDPNVVEHYELWGDLKADQYLPFGPAGDHVTNLHTASPKVIARLEVGTDALKVCGQHIDVDSAKLSVTRFDATGEINTTTTLPLADLEPLTLFEMVHRVHPEWVERMLKEEDARRTALLPADIKLMADDSAGRIWF